MYRCRRIIAIVLSLAVITSFFVFNASAESVSNIPPIDLIYQTSSDGVNWSANKDTPFVPGVLSPTYTKYVRLMGFRIWGSGYEDTQFWIRFRVSGLGTKNALANWNCLYTSATGAKANTSSSDQASLYFYGLNSGPAYFVHQVNDTAYKITAAQSVTYFARVTINQSPSAVNFMFTTPIFINPSDPSTISQLDLYIDDFMTYINEQEFYNSWFAAFQSEFQSMGSSLNHIDTNIGYCASYLLDIQTRFSSLFTNTYYWKQVEYDPLTEQLTIRQESGSYWNALLGSIQSISADAEAQAAMQQKANEKGAGDALDDAYDSAGNSFGSLSDFSGINDAAPWNPSQFSDRTESGFLGWFSTATQNSIDAVPRSRAPADEDIVDFYSSNLEDILDSLGGD